MGDMLADLLKLPKSTYYSYLVRLFILSLRFFSITMPASFRFWVNKDRMEKVRSCE